VQQGLYKAFIPSTINRAWTIDNMEVVQLLSQADRQLGKLDMFSEFVNIDLYISMHIAKEATLSARIEGTQTTMEEAFLKKEDVLSQSRDDWEEVQNYIAAMNIAVQELNQLPFSSRLIKRAHQMLLQGVRGAHKRPGEFRNSQNWIGGASLTDARFIPPPHTALGDLMSDLEHFANEPKYPVPDLIKIAIIHYQFETIHPFLDGNGRVGRLMVPLYLVSEGILKKPILYLSDFFEKHRTLYYDNLMRVRTHDDMDQWLRFFLTGIIETAKQGVQTFEGIMKLQKSVDQRLKSMKSRATDIRKVIDSMYVRPVVDINDVVSITKKSSVSAYKTIATMEKAGILKEITGAQRGRVYAFDEYLQLFSSIRTNPRA